MVKVSTLFYRVDGFNGQNTLAPLPDVLNKDPGDQFLEDLLSPLIFDPGEKLVKTICKNI